MSDTPDNNTARDRLREKILSTKLPSTKIAKQKYGELTFANFIQPSQIDPILDIFTAELSAFADEVESRWYSTKEKMPEESEFVLARLVWVSGKEIYQVLQHKILEDNEPWLCDGDELDYSVTVTHWKRFDTPSDLHQLRKQWGIDNKTKGCDE